MSHKIKHSTDLYQKLTVRTSNLATDLENGPRLLTFFHIFLNWTNWQSQFCQSINVHVSLNVIYVNHTSWLKFLNSQGNNNTNRDQSKCCKRLITWKSSSSETSIACRIKRVCQSLDLCQCFGNYSPILFIFCFVFL